MGQKYSQLCEAEREQIYWLVQAGVSQAEIGRRLDRHPSTIQRELRRNKTIGRSYQPVRAERLTQRRRRRRYGAKIERLSWLEDHVRQGLAMGHSPEQIAGRLRRARHTISISVESIYRFIYGARGRKDKLHNYLAQAKSRRGRRARLGQRQPLIPDRVPISQRPAEIKSRLPFGHWEADLMTFASRRTPVLVLIEQRTRFLMAVRQDDKTSRHTAAKIKSLLAATPGRAKISVTFDNGGEFAAHRSIGVDTYFCDPRSPWQKGAVENAIGRLRRHLPRSIQIATVHNDTLESYVHLHNTTPRKCLGFTTPEEAFQTELNNLVALDL